MKRITLLGVCLFCFLSLFAQQPVTLKGIAGMNEGDFYYVTILSPKDSTIVDYRYFDVPDFTVDQIKTHDFIFQITSPLLYKTYSRRILNENKHAVVDVGTIPLEPEINALDEVVIAAAQPRVKVADGKLIYDIQHHADFRALGSLDDVMRRLPFVTVSDGDVSVFGKRNTTVLVNGRPPKHTNWELIPPEEIKEIEIITNPSAEYRADGMAVVNIITHRKTAKGLNGQLSSEVSKGEFWRSANVLQLGYATSNLNLYTNINYNPQKRKYVETYERDFSDGSKMLNTTEHIRNTTDTYNLLFGADYQLAPKHELSMQYQRGYEHPDWISTNVSTLYTAGLPHDFDISLNGGLKMTRDIYDMNYVYRIDSLGKELSVNAGYVDYMSKETNRIDILSEEIPGQKDSRSEAGIHLFTADISYLHITKKQFTGKVGLYYSHSENDSRYELVDSRNEASPEGLSPANRAVINENKFAGYVTGRKQWGKLHMAAGLRFEYMRYSNRDIDRNRKSKKYKDLFPSIELGYSVSEKLQTTLSFTRKNRYPSFHDLDPSTYYIDTLTYRMGNTDLQPEYAYNIGLNMVYNRFFVLDIAYSRIKDPINPFFIKRLNPNSMICIITTENLQKQDTWTATLSAPYQYRFWTMYNAFGFNYNRVKFEEAGRNVHRAKGMAYVYTHHMFRLPLQMNLSLTYQYNSSGINGIIYHSDRHVFNCALNQSLLNDRLTLSLRYDDIFKGDRPKAWGNLHDIRFTQGVNYDTSYATFAVKYKFGTSGKKYQVKENSKEELKRIK